MFVFVMVMGMIFCRFLLESEVSMWRSGVLPYFSIHTNGQDSSEVGKSRKRLVEQALVGPLFGE